MIIKQIFLSVLKMFFKMFCRPDRSFLDPPKHRLRPIVWEPLVQTIVFIRSNFRIIRKIGQFNNVIYRGVLNSAQSPHRLKLYHQGKCWARSCENQITEFHLSVRSLRLFLLKGSRVLVKYGVIIILHRQINSLPCILYASLLNDTKLQPWRQGIV